MSARFLCTADVHIGRSSSGFENETALAAFERVVDLAIAEKADGLLIAGDLFDSIDAQFLTRAEVALSLKRLKDQGIPVIAVAGNHDYDALPAFVNVYPDLLQLLSAQEWESREVAGVAIVGRSFATATAAKPLIDNFPGADSSLPTIGLLHADIDAKSPYNPTASSALAGRGVQAWVLGHVHASNVFEDALAVYTGSPQALDAGEKGLHGVRWLIVNGSTVSLSPNIPISSVRFETEALEIEPDMLVDDLILDYLSRARIGEEKISLRVKLRRRLGANPSVPDDIVTLDQDLYEVVDVGDAMELNLDLDQEAEHSDARGQAARLLLGLEGRGNQEWIRKAAELVAQVKAEMEAHRLKLKLGGREEFRLLAIPAEDEPVQAIRASLESVIASTEGSGR